MIMIRNVLSFLFLILLFSYCGDKVKKYDGFTQTEMEYLLAADDLKVWERIGRQEDGAEVIPDDCGMENYLIFIQGSLGKPKPLLYAYNPLICDSLEFCDQHPDLCLADLTLCAENSEFCESLGDGTLYIGSWYAKEPFIKNSRTDTLIFDINNISESIFVTSITSLQATFRYKNREGENGGEIDEFYKLLLSPSE